GNNADGGNGEQPYSVSHDLALLAITPGIGLDRQENRKTPTSHELGNSSFPGDAHHGSGNVVGADPQIIQGLATGPNLSQRVSVTPPTSDEIEQFLNDKASDPHAQVVDRLLSSPTHGAASVTRNAPRDSRGRDAARQACNVVPAPTSCR